MGAAGFITRVAAGSRPYYVWKTDLLLSLSLKPGPDGLDVAQLRFDFPRFLGSRVRVMPGLSSSSAT